MRKRRKQSKTKIDSLSVAEDLEFAYEELSTWLKDEGLSRSRFLIEAALFCKRCGITDPAELGPMDAMFAGIEDQGFENSQHTGSTKSDGASLDGDALKDFDDLF